MPEGPEFPEYATVYSKEARPLRDALPAPLRKTLDNIEDMLSENPDGYPNRTKPLGKDIFMYTNPVPYMLVTYRIDREKKIIYFVHIAAPKTEVSKPLLISYSHKDKEWLDELKKWLRRLEKLDSIRIWDDTELKAGDDWRDEIEKVLADTKAAVLLISQDFLDSDFIAKNELPPLLEAARDERLAILWIAVRASTVADTEIVKYQAVHKEPPLIELDSAARDRAFLQIYEEIKKTVG